jgi:hypothetical protein
MAKKNDVRQQLYRALKVLGEQITKRQHTKTYQRIWDKITQQYIDKGETPPNLKDLASQYAEQDYENNTRNDDMQTPPATEDLDEQSAENVINDFEARIDRIYQTTISYIADNKEGTGHEGGKLASIADHRRSEIDDAYWTLKTQLQEINANGIPKRIIAQAIVDNVELDYDIAVTLVPPSDIAINFEETVQQLFAIMQQIEKRADELAEEMERKEYYGE